MILLNLKIPSIKYLENYLFTLIYVSFLSRILLFSPPFSHIQYSFSPISVFLSPLPPIWLILQKSYFPKMILYCI